MAYICQQANTVSQVVAAATQSPTAAGDKLDVKEGPEGMFVPGLRMEEVINIDELMAALQKGKQNRSTFSTNMNEHSSRSHLVLSMYVRGQRKDTGKHE